MNAKLAEKIVKSYFRDNVRGCPLGPEEIFVRGYVDDTAVIHETAEVDPLAIIGPEVVIGAHTKIKKALISRFAHIGANNVIEDYTIFAENARIGDGNVIGADNLFEDGCVIGNKNKIKNSCYFDRWALIRNNCTIGDNVTTRARVIIEDGAEVPPGTELELRERVIREIAPEVSDEGAGTAGTDTSD